MVDHLFALAELVPAHERQVIHEAMLGEPLSQLALLDIAEEIGVMHPFVVGQAYYFETHTLYWVGRVLAVSPCWLKLDLVSCVIRTGRKSTLMRNRSFAKDRFPKNELTPRTEFVGSFHLAIGAITGFEGWPVENLPTESIQ